MKPSLAARMESLPLYFPTGANFIHFFLKSSQVSGEKGSFEGMGKALDGGFPRIESEHGHRITGAKQKRAAHQEQCFHVKNKRFQKIGD